MAPDLISVIIPAYNVDRYLKKCVESVVHQTWKNIEIIIVDDGSTDNTGELCDELAKTYQNIIVIHQLNGGLSVARNTGLEHSKGEWIAFLDSDDWVEPDMYETLYSIAVKNNICLSSCLSRNVGDELSPNRQGDDSIHILNYDDIIHGLLTGNIMRFEVWNKLWKRELIDDVRFIPGQVAEDVHFDRILFAKAGKIAHINKVMHNYLISRPGNTNSSFKIARLCIFDEFKQWKQELENNNETVLACSISAIATNFAVDIYGNAVRSNQNQTILNELKSWFDFFFPLAFKAKLFFKRRVKFFLFWISPLTVKLYRYI